MDTTLDHLATKATSLLHELCTEDGILASTIEADNYKRVWARDSIVCGIAGLWLNDPIITEGFKQSLITLGKKQHPIGMIPSNVLPNTQDVSYGSLVGRVDTSTWFIIGCCLYYQHTHDKDTWELLKPIIIKCREFLKACEFNARGWIYTPLSGNWADEYPIHGYTLYDNTLRMWGETLWLEINAIPKDEIEHLITYTKANFWPSGDTNEKLVYQKTGFDQALQQNLSHYAAFILPGIYDNRFDAAGNALAILLFGLEKFQKDSLSNFIMELPEHLIPAFWPFINEQSPDWNLLAGNYSYSFKNQPGDFHNGGIWPVWMGLFCYAIAKQGMASETHTIVTSFLKCLPQEDPWEFQEYLNLNEQRWKGKTQMGYSAAGVVFMKLAREVL